jgi:hypothetical protein
MDGWNNSRDVRSRRRDAKNNRKMQEATEGM